MATYKKKSKAKSVDLKPKSVTNEELSLIKGLVGEINKIHMRIGSLEFEKSMFLSEISKLNTKLQENNVKLKEKYGDVSVNIQDGTIKTLPQNEKLNS